ncbi:MAG: hypothetical protein FWF45_01490 [Coriobacteriia bacterium]|nr:hypothetical protein [Coriobacteriia bacterium]
MLAILIVFALVLFCAAFRLIVSESTLGETLIVGVGMTGLAIILIAQLWSIGHLLSTWTVALSWLALVVAAEMLCFRKAGGVSAFMCYVLKKVKNVKNDVATFSRTSRVLIAALVLCFITTLFQAVVYPVINWDSLAHIMPRVFFWIQQGSVSPFAASYGQQLTTYPFAAYAITQIKLLSFGSDLFVNTVQWGAYVFACLLVAGITHCLGGQRTACLLSALAAATIPMALLQAVTTQYDLVVAAFMLASVYLILRLGDQALSGRAWRGRLCLLALVAGLGLLAKITWLLVTWPFIIALVVVVIQQKRMGREGLTLVTLSIMVLLFLLPVAGWFGSNALEYHGDFLLVNVEGNSQILIPDRTPNALVTELVRNTFMEAGTPVPGVNARLLSAAKTVVRTIGLDLNAPTNKETRSTPYSLNTQITNHDMASAPLTAVLILFSLIVLIACARRTRPARRALVYLGLAALGFCSIATLITWQPYITRTLVGPLMALTPAFGCAGEALAARATKPARLTQGALGAVFATNLMLAVLVVAFNSTSPLLPASLIGRGRSQDVGFWNVSRSQLTLKTLAPSLVSTADFLAQDSSLKAVKRVGLAGDAIKTQPLYPLLTPLAKKDVSVLPEAAVDGSARFVSKKALPPDLILDFSGKRPLSRYVWQDHTYQMIRSVFMPETQSWLTLYLISP